MEKTPKINAANFFFNSLNLCFKHDILIFKTISSVKSSM